MHSTLSFSEDSIYKSFDSNDELDNYLRAYDPQSDATPISLGIVFENYDSWDSISYTIRTNGSMIPESDKDETTGSAVAEWNYFAYGKPYQEAIIPIQLWINQSIYVL